MDQIYLTFREKCLLFFMRYKKKVKPRFDVSHLYDCNLIAMNFHAEKNKYGASMPDGTFSLTDFELRFRIANRQDRWKRIVTPIFVSVASSIITAAVTAIVTVLLMEK